jgi:hypothetical protein
MESFVKGEVFIDNVRYGILSDSLHSAFLDIQERDTGRNIRDISIWKITLVPTCYLTKPSDYSDKPKPGISYSIINSDSEVIGTRDNMAYAVAAIRIMSHNDIGPASPVALVVNKRYEGNVAYYKWKQARIQQEWVDKAIQGAYIQEMKSLLSQLEHGSPKVCNWIEARKAHTALINLVKRAKHTGDITDSKPIFVIGLSGKLR